MLPALLATTVFGLAIGQPLTLPECLREPDNSNIYRIIQPVTCQHLEEAGAPRGLTAVRVIFPSATAPSLVHEQSVEVFLLEGRVSGVEYETIGVEDQDAVLEQLTAKFGPPSSIARPVSQNRNGAKFAVIDADWSRPDLNITFLAAPVRFDLGWVTIETPAVKALRDDDRKQRESQRTPL